MSSAAVLEGERAGLVEELQGLQMEVDRLGDLVLRGGLAIRGSRVFVRTLSRVLLQGSCGAAVGVWRAAASRTVRGRLVELEAREGEVQVIMGKAKAMMVKGERVMERGRRWQAAQGELTVLEQRVREAKEELQDVRGWVEGCWKEVAAKQQEVNKLNGERKVQDKQVRAMQRQEEVNEVNLRDWRDAVEAEVLWEAGDVVLGGDGEQVMESVRLATAGQDGFWCKAMPGGLTLSSYSHVHDGCWGVGVIPAVDKAGGTECGVARRAMVASVRRQCRGLVVGVDGVRARPLQTFFSVGQVGDMKGRRLAEAEIMEATEKLDGTMVYGVLVEEGWELWSKGGPGEVAEGAMGWVMGEGAASAGDVVGLLEVAEAMGCTAVFEWVGRQARVKVKEEDTRLVLLQVRHKVSGGYVEYSVRRSMAEAHGVEVVGSRDDLVGCSFGEALERVRRKEGRKGWW